MYQDVEKYIKQCDVCKQYKPVNTARPGLMGSPKNINKPFEGISVDTFDPLPTSKNRNNYLLVCSDYFSKYILLHPMRNATGVHIAKYLEKNVFLVHGVPKYIFMDNGPQFISKPFRDVLIKYNIPNIFYNPRYHPQVNQAERQIRNVSVAIASYVKSEHRNWDENISQIQCALNSSVNETTKFTPFFLVHGREYIVDGALHDHTNDPVPYSQIKISNACSHGNELTELQSIYNKVSKHIQSAHHRNANHYNMRKRNIELSVGQIVYKLTHYLSDADKRFSKKLAPKFQKCIIVAKLSPLVYTLKDMNGKNLGNWHIKDILKYDD